MDSLQHLIKNAPLRGYIQHVDEINIKYIAINSINMSNENGSSKPFISKVQ